MEQAVSQKGPEHIGSLVTYLEGGHSSQHILPAGGHVLRCRVASVSAWNYFRASLLITINLLVLLLLLLAVTRVGSAPEASGGPCAHRGTGHLRNGLEDLLSIHGSELEP